MGTPLELKCITWNVRGLHTMLKRHRIHAYLTGRGAQIAFLQETHLTQPEGRALQRRWRGQVFATAYSAFVRGALIWVRAGVPFQPLTQIIDPEGRFAAVHGRLDGRDLLLCSV